MIKLNKSGEINKNNKESIMWISNLDGMKRGNKKLFTTLNKHQLKDTIKMKFCDHIVVNNQSLSILKKRLFNIIKLYEWNFLRYGNNRIILSTRS